MLEKLSFLKNKLIAYIAIGTIALIGTIATICGWADYGFTIQSLVVTILTLCLFGGLVLSIWKENKPASIALSAAYLYMVGINAFQSGCANAQIDTSFGDVGNIVAYGVFMLLAGLCLLTTFVLFAVEFFIGKKSIFGLINLIACGAGSVFALVSLIISFTMEVGASTVFSGIQFFLLPLAVFIVSVNMPGEEAAKEAE